MHLLKHTSIRISSWLKLGRLFSPSPIQGEDSPQVSCRRIPSNLQSDRQVETRPRCLLAPRQTDRFDGQSQTCPSPPTPCLPSIPDGQVVVTPPGPASVVHGIHASHSADEGFARDGRWSRTNLAPERPVSVSTWPGITVPPNRSLIQRIPMQVWVDRNTMQPQRSPQIVSPACLHALWSNRLRCLASTSDR